MSGTLSELNTVYRAERRRACGDIVPARHPAELRRAEREVLRSAGGCLIFLCVACPLWMAGCVLAWPGMLAVAARVAAWFGR